MATNMFSLGQAFSDMETSPVYAWKDFERYFYPSANQFRRFTRRGGEQDQLYNQFKENYLANSGQAQANADIYRNYAQGLFENQPNQFNDYRQVGDYLYGKFDEFRDTSAASGMRDMNSRLAAQGIRPGSTGYDRLLNANRITNNLAPAFANTTNAIGRDYNALAGNDLRQTMLRLGLAQDDALTGYSDNVAYRPLDVAGARMGLLAGNNQLYGDLVNNYMRNIAGYETKETSDWAKGIGVVDNLLNGAVDLYMSAYGGGMMGGGQAGSGQQINPYTAQLMPQGGYPTNTGVGQPIPAAQNQAWMREFYGGQPPLNSYQQPGIGYLGDVNVNPYLAGVV